MTQVLRDFRVPDGMAPEDMDATGDGELLVVLDLRLQAGLAATGLARELLNRVQKLRKRAGLVASDAVDVFYRAPSGPPSCEHETGRGWESANTLCVVDFEWHCAQSLRPCISHLYLAKGQGYAMRFPGQSCQLCVLTQQAEQIDCAIGTHTCLIWCSADGDATTLQSVVESEADLIRCGTGYFNPPPGCL